MLIQTFVLKTNPRNIRTQEISSNFMKVFNKASARDVERISETPSADFAFTFFRNSNDETSKVV